MKRKETTNKLKNIIVNKRIPNGIYGIFHSEDPSLALSLSEKSEEEDVSLQMKEWKNDDNEDQLFYLLFDEDDKCYSIINLFSSKTIGVVDEYDERIEIKQREMIFEKNFKWKLNYENGKVKFQLFSNDYFIGLNNDYLFDNQTQIELVQNHPFEFKLIKLFLNGN